LDSTVQRNAAYAGEENCSTFASSLFGQPYTKFPAAGRFLLDTAMLASKTPAKSFRSGDLHSAASFGTPFASVGGAPGDNYTEVVMLWTIFVILLIAWILGLVGVYQIGAIVWLLLVAALIVLVLQLVSGRRTVV
jgi:hypothetical protein